MEDSVARKLLDINDKFYQSFGQAFAETRRRLQPGVERIMAAYLREGSWLDLGCGSGVLGQRLAQNGFQGLYLGLDFSTPLHGKRLKAHEPSHMLRVASWFTRRPTC
jgi:2-polyprenyl-3-methyl-5-hydroxy-6-metoxy-1,4-benzoquinol methylase